MNDAKSLITGLNENDPRAPRRPMGRQGPGMMNDEPGGLSLSERVALKDLVLIDMLAALGNDDYYKSIVDAAINGTTPEPGIIQHFFDEGGKWISDIPPHVSDLMRKFASMRK